MGGERRWKREGGENGEGVDVEITKAHAVLPGLL